MSATGDDESLLKWTLGACGVIGATLWSALRTSHHAQIVTLTRRADECDADRKALRRQLGEQHRVISDLSIQVGRMEERLKGV